MSHTERMVALLAEMRRERNGAVADMMRYDGRRYGLNYGVSLPTLRMLARAEVQDADFARYLYLQDVRELHLAALHLMPSDALSDIRFWADGIYNSEVAEETAFALLGRVPDFGELFVEWVLEQAQPLLAYAALLAAARLDSIPEEWCALAFRAVARGRDIADTDTMSGARAARLVAQGAVAMSARLAATGHADTVRGLMSSLGDTAAESYLREELEWQVG